MVYYQSLFINYDLYDLSYFETRINKYILIKIFKYIFYFGYIQHL